MKNLKTDSKNGADNHCIDSHGMDSMATIIDFYFIAIFKPWNEFHGYNFDLYTMEWIPWLQYRSFLRNFLHIGANAVGMTDVVTQGFNLGERESVTFGKGKV